MKPKQAPSGTQCHLRALLASAWAPEAVVTLSHPIMGTCPAPAPPPTCAAGTCFAGSVTELMSAQLLT